MKIKLLLPSFLVLSFCLFGGDFPSPGSDTSEADLPPFFTKDYKSEAQEQWEVAHSKAKEGDKLDALLNYFSDLEKESRLLNDAISRGLSFTKTLIGDRKASSASGQNNHYLQPAAAPVATHEDGPEKSGEDHRDGDSEDGAYDYEQHGQDQQQIQDNSPATSPSGGGSEDMEPTVIVEPA